MKITRRQLRRLIETTIKPSIPNVPSDAALGKIDVLARADDNRLQADSLASAFDYPEDRSYADDLAPYDAANRVTIDTVDVSTGQATARKNYVSVPIPYELVDALIERYEDVIAEEGNMHSSSYGIPYDPLRDAGTDIFRHIHNHLDDKYGRGNYDIYSYGANGASGYRSDAYGKAMEKVGELI